MTAQPTGDSRRGRLDEGRLAPAILCLYALASIAELGLCVAQDLCGKSDAVVWGRVISKSSLMPLLFAWLSIAWRPYRRAQREGSRDPVDISVKGVLLALGFSLVGDVFLLDALGDAMLWFLLGVVGFALAHGCYVYSFVSRVELKGFWRPFSLVCVLPYLVYGYLLFSTIYPRLSTEKLAAVLVPGVLVYTAALLATAITMLVRKVLDQDAYSTNFLVVGAILFVESDSIIAVQKYGPGTIWFGTTAIMLTYVLGQFLIAYGVLVRLRWGLNEGPDEPSQAA